jgi:surface-adhesin protein E
MRGTGLALVATAMMSGAAVAQTSAQPTANTVAAAEVALHCTEIVERADQMASFALYAPGEQQPAATQLAAIDLRYKNALPAFAAAAGYPEAKVMERRSHHKQKIASLKNWQVRENVDSCALGDAPIPATSFMEKPTTGFAFAMAGRGANDVLYIDTASLHRTGGSVAGWQLYIFKADQAVDGKVAKAQWTPFRARCIGQPEIATYGSIWLGDPMKNEAPVADKRGAANLKPVAPNTFGAVTWMIACDVTPPTVTYASLAGAADHTKAQFGQ